MGDIPRPPAPTPLASGGVMLQTARVPLPAPRPLALRLAMVSAVLAIFGLAYFDLRREQERALDDFGAQQAALARGFAATVEGRVDGVLRELDSAAALVGAGQGEPLLTRLVASDPAYRKAWVVDGDGAVVFAAGRAGEEAPGGGAARREAVARARKGHAVVAGDGRMRLVAQA